MSAAEELTRALGGDWHGQFGSIPTPGHSALDRGTTIRDRDDGAGVVVHCFNGSDDAWRQVQDEGRRLGIIAERSEPSQERQRWRDMGFYEYADADGVILYRTVRMEWTGRQKRFRAERACSQKPGGWHKGLGDVLRVPYRLPALMTANPSRIVYLAEGERKADKLADMGFVATAVAFGAKGWRREYAEHFAGRTVAILPDNDDEGRGFAAKASESIAGVGGRAVIVELPGLPPKGDIIDWTGTADELQALTDAALANSTDQDDPLAGMTTVAASADVDPPDREWMVQDNIPVGAATGLFGDGGTGKTTIAMQIGVAIERGLLIFGLRTKRVPVLGIFAEDDKDELDRRFKAICASMGVPRAAVTGFHYESRFGKDNLLGRFDADGKFHPNRLFAGVRAKALATGARLIILDNVSFMYPDNINDPPRVTRFVAALNGLAADINGAVLLLGHVAKTAGSQFAGTMAWSNACRSRIFIDYEQGEVANPDVRAMSRPKANYSARGGEMKLVWHAGAFILLDDLPADVAEQMAANLAANADNGTFLDCLRERDRQGEGRQVGPAVGPNYAPKQFEGMTQAKGLDSKRLKHAMDRLFAIGEIESFTYRNTAKARDVTLIREVTLSPRTTTPNASRTVPERTPEPTPNQTPNDPAHILTP